MIYLDNAATTYPKPESVYRFVQNFIREIGANPGRSAHTPALEAGKVVFEAREKISEFFNIKNSERVIFTSGCTESLNTVILGIVNERERVVITSMEHNSVTRPLKYLKEKRDIEVIVVESSPEGEFNLKEFEKVVSCGVKLAVINHGSNVTGTIAPLEVISSITRKYGVLLLVDCAQTAGHIKIDVEKTGVDFLAFSGHKGLYGLQGTGCLYIKDEKDLVPLKFGGTGSNSESDEQPQFLPDKFESGTRNGPGIAGIFAGVNFIEKKGLEKIAEHDIKLKKMFIEEVKKIQGVKIYGPENIDNTLPIVSFNLNGMDNGKVARELNDRYHICVRAGLHCAPFAHRTIGTFPQGTIRVSFGYFNTEDDVKKLISAIKRIVK